MEKPVYVKNAAGQIVEYQPVVAPDREVLANEYAAAQKDQTEVDRAVLALEKRRDDLQDQVDKVDDTLKVAYAEQEKVREIAAFRKTKLGAYDQALASDPLDVDGEPGEGVEDVAADPVAGQPSSEDVAATLESDDDTDEPDEAETDDEDADEEDDEEESDEVTATTETQEVVVRRRSRV